MSIREKILSRPPAAQIVIKAYATKRAVYHPGKTYAQYSAEAIVWWDDALSSLRARLPNPADADEERLATLVLEQLGKQYTWGRILREGTN